MGAKEDARQIEETTDWPALIERALADPPEPDALLRAFQRWATAFTVAYGGPPLRPDFPPDVDDFFRKLAFAEIPPEATRWIENYERKHGRPPALDDLPRHIRALLPKEGGRQGRPRCDTARLEAAARAWKGAVFRGSYETRRDIIGTFGRLAGFECFGFSQTDIQNDRPSALALEKLSGETDLSESRLADLIGLRGKSKK